MQRNRESGLTIPMAALFMVILIVMLALAVDVGVLYTARTSAQHAADAAALAGAFTYVTNPTASNPTGTATAAAMSAATQNKILGTLVPAAEVTVTPSPPYVTVSLTHIAPTAFAKVIGTNQATIKVTARAQGGGQAVGTTCLRPFWILRSLLGSCSSPPTAGQALTLHNGTAASQWGFICEGGSCGLSGGGANAIMDAILSCQNVRIKCGDPVMVETGDISAIDHMHPTPEFFGPNPDYFYGVGDYALGGPSGPRSATSDSVLTVAILDDCNGQTPPTSGGNQSMNVDAFGEIFIGPSASAAASITGNGNSSTNPLTINGNLVSFNGCGTGGGGGTNTGAYAVPVRLVQTP